MKTAFWYHGIMVSYFLETPFLLAPQARPSFFRPKYLRYKSIIGPL